MFNWDIFEYFAFKYIFADQESKYAYSLRHAASYGPLCT